MNQDAQDAIRQRYQEARLRELRNEPRNDIRYIEGQVNMPVIEVVHSELTRYGDSAYKSCCPSCETGILLMRRDSETLVLEEYDTCSFCYRRFRYTDIDQLRRMENGFEEDLRGSIPASPTEPKSRYDILKDGE